MTVGTSITRREGYNKLTGRAQYIDDLSFPEMLHGKTVRSTIAHGQIKNIIFDPAFDWSVVTIADWRDIPGRNIVALIEEDQPLLAKDFALHYAEPILLVAAETKEIAETAVSHIKIDYEELPAVFSIQDSLKSSVRIYGENNVFKKYVIDQGDVVEGFRESTHVIEGEYIVRHQEQLYIEPQGVIAVPREDGGMTVYGSMQCPYYVHKAIKANMALPDDRVNVIQTVTGGGFGGKEEYPSVIAGHAAVLARKAGRPVKMIYDRAEDLAATPKRHPAIIKHKTGLDQDGKINAVEIEIDMDGGAYATLSSVVLSRAAIHALGPYKSPNVRIAARAIATNTPPNGAFRGFGVPQACFACELQMERIAKQLRIDPIDLRRNNLLRLGDITATGQRLDYSVSAEQVLDQALEHSRFYEKRDLYERQRKEDPDSPTIKGIGVSLFMHGAGFTGSGEDKMKGQAGATLTKDGRVKLLTASTEIGQGTRTIFVQIVASEIGIPIDLIEMEEPDTSKVPDSGPTVASRTCMIIGGVMQRVARTIKEALTEFVAERFGNTSIEIKDGQFVDSEGKSLIAFQEAAREYQEVRGALEVFHRYSSPPGIKWDDDEYKGDAYPVFSWAADVIEVEVDHDTYETTVLNITTAQDIGRAINPVLAAGQVEGGTLQAVGYALLEEVVSDKGRMLNNSLTNYIIPTSVDTPEIHTILVENEYPFGPFGAKGVGELPMDGPAPAIAAAILNATGVLVNELPITPERLEKSWRGL
ncbi:MAG TPA: xanthine dehydrogenase family protein molybdopterin-binding subunit [Blastocatellia bacterium]|nr:xanthine dehydrogenase family protein molybdopterin-binding subunit [Blastocatellia bacterium]